MTKFNINKAEAGALLLEISMKNLDKEAALQLIGAASFCKPSHTATVRRLARQLLWPGGIKFSLGIKNLSLN